MSLQVTLRDGIAVAGVHLPAGSVQTFADEVARGLVDSNKATPFGAAWAPDPAAFTPAEVGQIRASVSGAVVLAEGPAAAAANTAAVQAALDSTGSASITVPGVYLFDTSASPLLIPDYGSLYKGPGVVLKVADGSPSALITNHTARLPAVATVPGAQVTYSAAPDTRNYCAVVSGLTPAQLAHFPIGSYVSAVVLGHGALGAVGNAHNNRNYRGVHRVVANDGVSVLKYELTDNLWPGSAPAQSPVSLYRVTREPLVWGPGEIDGNGANADPAYNTGDPRGVVVWWHHAFHPRMEMGTFKRGKTWTIGANYTRHARFIDLLPRIRDDAVTSPSCDFIHICGQQDDVLVRGCPGDSGDNFVGFTEDCTEGTPYDFPYQFPGDMQKVRIEHVTANSISDHGNFGIIAFYGPAAYRYWDVAIVDASGLGSSVVQLSTYAATNMLHLTIDSLRIIRASGMNGGATVEITAGTFTLGEVLLDDVQNTRADVPTFNAVSSAVGTVRSLQLRKVGVLPYQGGATHARSVPVANFGGLNIAALSVENCEGIELNSNVVAFSANGAGNIGKVGFSNCSATGSGTAALWGDSGAGTAATPVYFNSTYNGARVSEADSVAAPATINASNAAGYNGGRVRLAAAATLTIDGGAWALLGAGLVISVARTGTATLAFSGSAVKANAAGTSGSSVTLAAAGEYALQQGFNALEFRLSGGAGL